MILLRIIFKLKKSIHFLNYFRPEYPAEQMDDDDEKDKDELDEAELDLQKIEEDMHRFDEDDVEEEENILNMEALNKLNTIKNSKVIFFA